MGYAKKETGAFLLGIFFLLAGSLSDFVVPLYIGFVIDALTIENYDIVGSYCLQLFLIVLVSIPRFKSANLSYFISSPVSPSVSEPPPSTSCPRESP